MRLYQLLLSIICIIFLTNCEVKDVKSEAQPIKHTIWNGLLQQHVDQDGWVNYKGFIQDSTQFNTYLDLLRGNHPNEKNWTEAERLAYWINAYNAFTIKLIVDYYPTPSIKEIKSGIPFINSVFDIKFITIEGVEYSLNNIEHGIIRPKFGQPLIHFAVNCASYSCPKLSNEAFCADKLEDQLQKAASDFVNDPTKNTISENQLELSRILQWYWMDFKDHYESRIDFLNQYSAVKINADAKTDFKDYDWSLNEQKQNN